MFVPGIARYKGSLYQIMNNFTITGTQKWIFWVTVSHSLYRVISFNFPGCVKGGQYCDCTILRTGTRESLSFSCNWVNYLSVSRVVNVMTAQHCAPAHGILFRVMKFWICVLCNCNCSHLIWIICVFCGKFCKFVNCVSCGNYSVMVGSPLALSVV